MVVDGTEKQVDEVTTTSPETKETSPKTYTEEQVAERERKVRSDALAEAGRFRAESERAMKLAKAAQERVERMLKEQEESQLETYKDDPAEIRRIRAEQARKKAEADLDRLNIELSEKDERLKAWDSEKAEMNKYKKAQEISVKLGVDTEALVNLSRYTNGSDEAIEAIANNLPKKSSQQPVTPKNSLKPDSGRNLGGGASFKEVQAAFIKDPAKNAKRYFEMKSQQ